MNAAYSLSRSFGSRFGSKSIGNNTYTGRRSNFRSKLGPIHVPVNKYELNFSLSRIHFSRLPQAVYKNLLIFCTQKLVML